VIFRHEPVMTKNLWTCAEVFVRFLHELAKKQSRRKQKKTVLS
jgi:hypothetical protein